MTKPYVVGIGGTTRANSSTEKALRFALAQAAERGARTRLFAADELSKLPLYAPENPERVPEAVMLCEAMREADGFVIGSPGYHGSISGLVKNALDYVEDMREDDNVYWSSKPVGLVATGYGWQGVVTTLDHLRTVVHTLRGWPTPLGAALNTSEKLFGDDGDVIDDRARFQLTTVAQEVLAFCAWRSAALERASG